MTLASIPSEIWVNIFSNLSLEDRMSCRSVCKSFKEHVDLGLKRVTHLRISGRDHEFSPGCYIKETFLSEPFASAREKDEHLKTSQRDEFFTFIGKFCPKLRVLDAKKIRITLENLVKVANNLEYFRCSWLEVAKKQRKSPESVFAPFRHLQTFDLPCPISKQISNFSLVYQLFRQNRPIFRLYLPNIKQIDQKEWQTICRQEIKCLSISSSKYDFLPIPDSLASTLVDIYVKGFVEIFFSSRLILPSLVYLRLDWANSEFIDLSLRFPCTPNLRHLNICGPYDFDSLELVLSQLPLLEKLETVVIKLDWRRESKSKPNGAHVPFHVSDSLKKIILNMDDFLGNRILPIVFSNCNSGSLEYLECNRLASNQFQFVNMKVLDLQNEEVSPELVCSLSLCSTLTVLKLKTVKSTPSNLQSFFDTLQGLLHLQKLILKVAETKGPEAGKISVKQEHIAQLGLFEVEAPFNFILFPTDAFDFMDLSFLTDNCRVHYVNFQFTCNDPNLRYMLQCKSVELKLPSRMGRLEKLRNEVASDRLFGFFPLDELLLLSFNLRSFSHRGKVTFAWLGKVFQHFHSLEKLTDVTLNITLKEAGENQELETMPSLAPHIRCLNLHSNKPVELCNSACQSPLMHPMSSLVLTNCVITNFNFPNLEKFHLSTADYRPFDLPYSLEKCQGLRSLKIEFDPSNVPSARDIQSLLSLVERMPLETLFLDLTYKYHRLPGEKNADACVVVNQNNMPSLRHFRLNLPIDVVFHPCDTFKMLYASDGRISFTSDTHDFSFHADTNAKLEINSNMQHMTHLKFHPKGFPFEEHLIAKLKHFTCVEHVYFWNDSSFTLHEEFISWVSSLSSLKKFSAPTLMSHAREIMLRLREQSPRAVPVSVTDSCTDSENLEDSEESEESEDSESESDRSIV